MGWTTDQSLLRDRIIGKAQKGRWTAEVAEKVAGRLDVGPLRSTPDLADYDPLQETYWSIPMTLEWIRWRDADHVREYWDDWRMQCIDWRSSETRMPDGEIVIVWRLEQMNSISLKRLRLERLFTHGRAREHISGNSPLIVMSKAQKKLSKQLQLGTLVATGIPPRENKRSPIPAESWQDLELSRSGVRGSHGELKSGKT